MEKVKAKIGLFAALAKMLSGSSSSGKHNARGYKHSGRDGFAYIASISRRRRRKLRTGR